MGSDGIEIQDSRKAQGANQTLVGGGCMRLSAEGRRSQVAHYELDGCGLDCRSRKAAIASLILNVDSIVTIRLLPFCLVYGVDDAHLRHSEVSAGVRYVCKQGSHLFTVHSTRYTTSTNPSSVFWYEVGCRMFDAPHLTSHSIHRGM